MIVTEILQFVDQLVFTKTNKHLDDLQKKIIKEVFQGKTYKEIADFYDYDEGYIGDESRKIFKILSEKLGEDINKNNFIWTIERAINSQLVNIVNGNLNYCLNHQFSNKKTINKNLKETNYHDLTFAPQILKFYDRETELKTLSNLIFNQKIKLISVLGLAGIGKTYLVKRFIDLNLENFEVIIWKTLNYPQSLNSLINDVLTICEQEIKETIPEKLKQIFDIFKDKRCLIILDDLQNIFIKGEFAGQYQAEFQDYQNFFKMITETEHQSKLILISQEECAEMGCFDEDLSLINYLKLTGLDNIEILKNMGFQDESNSLKLLNLYEGNPFYLKEMAHLIKNVFNSNLAEFLAEDELIITQNIKNCCQILFNKLSSIEQEIILKISEKDQHLVREELKENLGLSSIDLMNGLHSLQQRCLLKKIEDEKQFFVLAPIFKQYLRLL